jgi:hypothetical protein
MARPIHLDESRINYLYTSALPAFLLRVKFPPPSFYTWAADVHFAGYAELANILEGSAE